MTGVNKIFTFRQNCVAVAVAMLLTQSVYALQDLSDSVLSATTGEGVALLPENFKMVFQGPNDVSAASSYGALTDPVKLLEASKKDTGFIRIIPRGGNYEKLFEQSRQAVYDNIYFQKYSTVVPSYYQKYYTDVKNAEYSKVYNDAALRKDIKSGYSATYKESFDSQKVEEYAAQTYYVSRYNTLYQDKYNSYNWCFHTSSLVCMNKEETQAWAHEAVRAEIRTSKAAEITAYTDGLLESKTDAEMDLRAIRAAKLKAQASYAEKEAELKASALADAANALNTTDHVAALKASRTKADIFIYGLALSKSNGNMNQRYSNQGINWGSAANPWLLRSGTAADIQQFTGSNKDKVAYIALEAPLAQVGGNSVEDKIKLGFWMDIFSRSLDSSSEVDIVTGAPTSGLDKEYRLRTQLVANGLSIDGSQVRLFQTQSSSLAQQNQTLGMASIIRLNTNDNPATLKDTDTDLDARGIRISTAPKTDTDDGTAATPALDGSNAPLFNAVEGLYLYSANMNLVLGNMYQPFIIGSEGNNIILEVTHIPNVPEIYSKIYTWYKDTDPNPTFNTGTNLTTASFKGSTCNVAYCGSNTSMVTAGGASVNYQGTNATHSSISVGSVTLDPATNMLKANRDASATGVVFKNVSGSVVNMGSAVIDGVLIQHLKIKTTGL